MGLNFVTSFILQNDTTAAVNNPTEESSVNSSPAFSFLAGSATEFELLAQAGRFKCKRSDTHKQHRL